MRLAGCVINDYADWHFDGHVERPAIAPWPGVVDETEALLLFAISPARLHSGMFYQSGHHFPVGCWCYAGGRLPFMKRYTFSPQVVLGAAFAWAIPMAYFHSRTRRTGAINLATLSGYATLDRRL